MQIVLANSRNKRKPKCQTQAYLILMFSMADITVVNGTD